MSLNSTVVPYASSATSLQSSFANLAISQTTNPGLAQYSPSDSSFAVSNPADIAREMEQRNANIGYVIGFWLGKLIGTRGPNERMYSEYEPKYQEGILDEIFEPVEQVDAPVEDFDLPLEESPTESAGFFSNFWQSAKSTVQSSAKGVSYYLKKAFGTIQAVDSVISISTNKQAIQFVGESDSNGVFKDSSTVSFYNEVSLHKQGYSLERESIGDVEDICKVLTERYPNRKFDLIGFNAHGGRYYAEFGSMLSSPNPTLNTQNIPQMLSCLPDHMHAGTKIIFRSCGTGDITNLPFHNKMVEKPFDFDFIEDVERGLSSLFYGDTDNLALATYRFLAEKFPNVEVSAPGLVSFGSYIQSVEDLEVISPSIYHGKDGKRIINSNLVYNKDSVALIDEGRELEKHQPGQGLFFSSTAKTHEFKEWQKQADEHSSQLKAVIRFKPDSHPEINDKYYRGSMYLSANAMMAEIVLKFAAGGAIAIGMVCYNARNRLKNR